ncbi:MAG: hypothetical protein V2B18_15815 [Pseudomonadota bacterium]
MNIYTPNNDEMCCCGPADGMAEMEACNVCAPKSVLTADEEVILSRLRELKAEARGITERMKRIHTDPSMEGTDESLAGGSELNDLNRQLNELRSTWGDWQRRLDDAIDRKLILLGHRTPLH